MSIMKYKLDGMSNNKFLFEAFLLFVITFTAYALLPEALNAYKPFVKVSLFPLALAYTYAGARFRWPSIATSVLAAGIVVWLYLIYMTLN